eukprot:m.2700 g.2700  ORF g.2700 m.2700 type:complete len:71 (-) comp1679_c0_seq1:336-548(-)
MFLFLCLTVTSQILCAFRNSVVFVVLAFACCVQIYELCVFDDEISLMFSTSPSISRLTRSKLFISLFHCF